MSLGWPQPCGAELPPTHHPRHRPHQQLQAPVDGGALLPVSGVRLQQRSLPCAPGSARTSACPLRLHQPPPPASVRKLKRRCPPRSHLSGCGGAWAFGRGRRKRRRNVGGGQLRWRGGWRAGPTAVLAGRPPAELPLVRCHGPMQARQVRQGPHHTRDPRQYRDDRRRRRSALGCYWPRLRRHCRIAQLVWKMLWPRAVWERTVGSTSHSLGGLTVRCPRRHSETILPDNHPHHMQSFHQTQPAHKYSKWVQTG